MAKITTGDVSFIHSHMLLQYTEAQWQAEVEELAALCGFQLQYHTHDSRGSEKGFPDIVLVKPASGRLVFFETKTEKKTSLPTQWQVDWVQGLRKTGVHAWIVRPRNFELVADILQGRANPPERFTGTIDEHLAPLLENELKVAPPKRPRPRRSRSRS